jgi:hypothetical protein
MVGSTFIFVVPVLYYKIFKFRQKQDNSVQGRERKKKLIVSDILCISGLSEGGRARRKQKNLVSTKLNLIAWILQVEYPKWCQNHSF